MRNHIGRGEFPTNSEGGGGHPGGHILVSGARPASIARGVGEFGGGGGGSRRIRGGPPRRPQFHQGRISHRAYPARPHPAARTSHRAYPVRPHISPTLRARTPPPALSPRPHFTSGLPCAIISPVGRFEPTPSRREKNKSPKAKPAGEEKKIFAPAGAPAAARFSHRPYPAHLPGVVRAPGGPERGFLPLLPAGLPPQAPPPRCPHPPSPAPAHKPPVATPPVP
jgi:hypothetical protein